MNVLITGGTGLVGTELSRLLQEAGHAVAHLTRGGKPSAYQAFSWHPEAGKLDRSAVLWADAIVHLAGAGVADERWTAARKREIIASRVDGLHLLQQALTAGSHHVRTVVSTSATGVYGDRSDQLMTETSALPAPGDDFLADVCQQWEAAATALRPLGLRVPIMRLGVVLSTEGGALPEIARPVKLGAGAALGSGKQWVSWIHIRDVARAYLAALTDERYTAVYNVTAPAPTTNAILTSAIADELHRPLLLPNVPAFALKLALGSERASIVLASQRATPGALTAAGFTWDFPKLEGALANLYRPKA
jgi:uncharacterized protein